MPLLPRLRHPCLEQVAFARPALPPNIDKLILRLLQHINQFAVGGAEEFVEARIIAACEVKNQLVHGILLPEGKTVRLYRFSTGGQTVPPLPLRQTACFQTACHFRRRSVTIRALLAALKENIPCFKPLSTSSSTSTAIWPNCPCNTAFGFTSSCF